MFKQMDSVPNIPELEKNVADYWKKLDIVNVLTSARKNSQKKVYYDGPITANGIPHYGHAITWTLKDLIPRYWSMKGYLVERNMGWDCQGIPVEYEVEKELGFKKKDDIEAYGVAKFNNLCREAITRNRDIIFHYETLLGRWFDPKFIYATMDRDYIESMWWSLKELFAKGLLYEGYKVVAYSTRAGTSLSSHEVAEGGYKDIEDTFVTVKFAIKNQNNTYFLAWTTTPWTIPGNLMLAVNEELVYAKVECDGLQYYVAKNRAEEIFKGKTYSTLEEVSGKTLVGIEYEPPFDYYSSKRTEGCFKTVSSYHANDEEGTGIVHLAPYGEADFDIFMALGIKVFDYLDDTANFTEEIPEYAGKFYKEANPLIVEDLRKRGHLFDSGSYLHRMPMCWRTGTPLIYKPVKSWYIAVTKIKERMLAENQTINWYPEHLKEGAAGIWLKNARDWALSRNRYWGTPLPVWINDKTKEKVFIGSIAELEKLSGQTISDPHRPYVDDIKWEDTEKGGTFIRVKDVIDVWYDSGSMPFARLHYPFANKENFNQEFPAEYISEGPDQVRLWFYTMHVLGVSLFDKVPYKNVVTIGMLLDDTGKKMSKSKRNYKPMDEVLNEYGGDVLRYFIVTSSIVNGQDTIFSIDNLKDDRKEFFLPLWNSVKYFTTYASLHNFTATLQKPKSTNTLDAWILARLQEVTNSVDTSLDGYQILDAAKMLGAFVSDLSTWYIRRSRDRIKDNDSEALNTLYYVLLQFTKLIAPFVPFFAESLYENLGARELTKLVSVHVDLYPEVLELDASQNKVLQEMKLVREIVSQAHAQRIDHKVTIRQPLAKLLVRCNETLAEKYINIIMDEINVKEVMFKTSEEPLNIELDFNITKDLHLEGLAREMVRKIQDLRKSQNLTITDRVNVEYAQTDDNNKAVAKFEEDIKAKVLADLLTPGAEFKVTKTS